MSVPVPRTTLAIRQRLAAAVADSDDYHRKEAQYNDRLDRDAADAQALTTALQCLVELNYDPATSWTRHLVTAGTVLRRRGWRDLVEWRPGVDRGADRLALGLLTIAAEGATAEDLIGALKEADFAGSFESLNWVRILCRLEAVIAGRLAEDRIRDRPDLFGGGTARPDDSRQDEPVPVPVQTPTVDCPQGRKTKGKNIAAQMLKVISDRPESIGWSMRQWAAHLKCATSTIQATTTWREHLPKLQAMEAVDRL